MQRGKTSKGFEFEISDTALDNYELVEALAKIKSDPFAMTTVVDAVFGDNKQAAFDFVKAEYGYVSTAGLGQLITDIFDSISGGKNS